MTRRGNAPARVRPLPSGVLNTSTARRPSLSAMRPALPELLSAFGFRDWERPLQFSSNPPVSCAEMQGCGSGTFMISNRRKGTTLCHMAHDVSVATCRPAVDEHVVLAVAPGLELRPSRSAERSISRGVSLSLVSPQLMFSGQCLVIKSHCHSLH